MSARAVATAARWASSPRARVGYVTDAEGNLAFFDRYVARSTVVRYSASGGGDELELVDDDAFFVFGGDVCDKGTGDIRLVRRLVRLQQRHPDRVFLLLGNRDINKLRFTSELAPDVLASESMANDRMYPYWVDSAKRVTPAEYRERKGLPDTPATRLRWMFAETMGADGLFDQRRAELAVLAGTDPDAVSDDDVIASFRHSVEPGHPDAFMLHYFRAACMTVRLGPHLIVHGAVTETAMGRVPGLTGPATTVDEWVDGLNAWTQQQLDDHAARPRWGSDRGRDRGGDALLDYGVPNGFDGATVVYASNLDNGNATAMKPAVATFLAASGVHSVLAGHVPHGDCPLIIRSDTQYIITADTSYSDMAAPDNRGIAVSEVVAHADGRIHVHGNLKDGREIDYWLPSLTDGKIANEGDPFIGRPLKDNSWVKAKLKNEDRYIACRGEGFKLHLRELTGAEVAAELAV